MLERVPDTEVHKVREYIKGRLLMRMEDSRAVAAWLSSQELLLGEITTPDETASRIDAVTPADVLRNRRATDLAPGVPAGSGRPARKRHRVSRRIIRINGGQ